MEQKSLLSYTPMHKCIMWPRYFFNKELQVVTRTRHLHKPRTVKRRSVVTLFISLIKISEKAIFFIILSQVGPETSRYRAFVGLFIYLQFVSCKSYRKIQCPFGRNKYSRVRNRRSPLNKRCLRKI